MNTFYFCKSQPAKWPTARRRADERAPRKTYARLGAWPPAFRSWLKLNLALRRTRGPSTVLVVASMPPAEEA